MSIKPLILLILLAVIPMGAFAWLGYRVSRSEAARVEQAYREVLQQRLNEENQRLAEHLEQVRRQLAELGSRTGTSPDALREMVRTEPLIRQLILLDSQGRLVHPAADAPRNTSEIDFLIEIEQLLKDRDLPRLAFPERFGINSSSAVTTKQTWANIGQNSNRMQSAYASEGRDDGWYVWYFGRGIHLMYWRRVADDQLLVAALSRSRWMADLLSLLPETNPATNAAAQPDDEQVGSSDVTQWRICLTDASNQIVYQWGRMPKNDDDQPMAEIPVVAPLNAWRLKYFVDQQNYRVSQVPVITGLTSVGVALIGLAVFLYRGFSQNMREARQRVNFVNQVSHELKTPLTNIRMYADLLEMDLEKLEPEDAERPLTRLEVIISESQRLTRLITNVLTFARAERRQLQINRQPAIVDDVVRRVIERFRPSLAAKRFQIEVDLQAESEALFDPDILEQIVGNLISNVDRYATDGKWIKVTTRQSTDLVTVSIEDRGPGIQPQLQQKVFEPFYRVSNRLNDANGTGIGLSISRQLAQLHGGNLTLQSPQDGSLFNLTLRCGTTAHVAASNVSSASHPTCVTEPQ